MKYFIYLLLFIFPLGQLARFNLFEGDVTIHLNDLIVGLTFLAWFFQSPKSRIKFIRQSKLYKPIAFFCFFITASLAANYTKLTLHELLVSSLYGLRWITFAGLYFVFKSQPEKVKIQVKSWFSVMVLIVAITGLLQYVFLPDVSFLKIFDWDDHYFRLIGSFLDPGFTGAILVLGLLLVFKFQVTNVKLAMVFLYLALALTYSRASYLMFLFSFGVVAIYKKSVKFFLIAAIILAVSIPLLPRKFGEGVNLSRENSTIARIRNWQQSIEIWKAHPFFGVGFDSYRYIRANITMESHAGAGADSSLLLILATTGSLGFLSYLWLLANMARIGRKNCVFIAGLIGIVIHSFFNNTLLYPWVMEWLWVVLAVTSEA